MLAVNQENEHLMEDYERLASDVSVSLTPSPGDPVGTESSGHLWLPLAKGLGGERESRYGSETF